LTKIAEVCYKYLPERGGIITHVKQISERLVARGHEVEVLTTDPSGKLKKNDFLNGVVVKRYSSLAPFHLYHFSLPLIKGVMKSHCDIIHCHGYQDFPLIASILAKGNRKLLVTTHSGWPLTAITRVLNFPYRLLVGRVLQTADMVIFVSQSEYRFLARRWRFPSSKIAILPNGASFIASEDHNEWPSTIPFRTRYILSVSGLRKYKGHDFLIKAFAKADFDGEEVKLVIAGSGDYESSLVRLVDILKLKDKVSIVYNPTDEELALLYRNCTLFVLLSQFESQSICLADAIAARVPVITTLVPGCEDSVLNGYARGIPFPPDIRRLSLMLEETLKEPRKYVPQESFDLLSWDEITRRLEVMYEEQSV